MDCRSVFALIAAGALCTAVGCSKGEQGPKLVPAGGSVSLDGKAAAGVIVVFNPVGSTKGQGANGQTDASGNYELMTRGTQPGVAAGEYKVSCSKYVMPDGSDIPSDPEFSLATSGAKQVLPARYSDPQETILKVTVPPEGGKFPLELKTK